MGAGPCLNLARAEISRDRHVRRGSKGSGRSQGGSTPLHLANHVKSVVQFMSQCEIHYRSHHLLTRIALELYLLSLPSRDMSTYVARRHHARQFQC
jgi:hypothetical protein